ncbi:High choriolytic enzyme 1 [Takifugu flavidus]|uniref:Metalloendopeptidase n=1 Tax=Takifugu flavidus TaxID=433684 RepID=A0A5C6NLW2_9TELE|nr:High choriolytic enzyme 1 [Takifugu flavidus]
MGSNGESSDQKQSSGTAENPGTGCGSSIGRQGGRQYISLQRPGYVKSGVVHHEILHALGFHHEQSHSDRDRFVTINYTNIQPGKEKNFRKVQTNNSYTDYTAPSCTTGTGKQEF